MRLVPTTAFLCYVDKEMIEKLRQLPLNSISLATREKRFMLHSMISSIGHSRERESTYYWDGMRRGNREFGVIQLTLGGLGVLEHDGSYAQVTTGDVFYIRVPSEHRYFLPESSPEWEFVYVVVYGMETMRILRTIDSLGGPVIRVNGESWLPALINDIFEYALRSSDPSAPLISSFAYRLIMLLSHEVSSRHRDSVTAAALNIGKRFARDNFAIDIGVEDMAQAADLSRSHFSRRFRESEGVSPREYLEHIRIKHSMSLLAQHEIRVKEVADRCGFRDENYFTRVFKRVSGMTPTQYRRAGP